MGEHMRLMMVVLLASPLAFGKSVNVQCNIVSQCHAEWESPLERIPPQLKLACQGQSVHAKISTTQESQWQKISFDF
jgi:hypothetical protein